MNRFAWKSDQNKKETKKQTQKPMRAVGCWDLRKDAQHTPRLSHLKSRLVLTTLLLCCRKHSSPCFAGKLNACMSWYIVGNAIFAKIFLWSLSTYFSSVLQQVPFAINKLYASLSAHNMDIPMGVTSWNCIQNKKIINICFYLLEIAGPVLYFTRLLWLSSEMLL